MWKAVIKTVAPPSIANDTINIDVEFDNGETDKSFTKSYNLHASNFKSIDDVNTFIQTELDNLSRFDGIIALLKEQIGVEVQATAKDAAVDA